MQETDTQGNESTDINETTTEYPNTWCIRGRKIPQSNEYPVRRTFSGAGNDVWNEFIQYNSTLKGHTAMKQRFVTEAKLRKRNPEESCRDFGQAIEDLYCRAKMRTLLKRYLTSADNQEIFALLSSEPDIIPCMMQ